MSVMDVIHLKLGSFTRVFPGRGEAFFTDGLQIALHLPLDALSLRLKSISPDERKADCRVASLLAKTDNCKKAIR